MYGLNHSLGRGKGMQEYNPAVCPGYIWCIFAV